MNDPTSQVASVRGARLTKRGRTAAQTQATRIEVATLLRTGTIPTQPQSFTPTPSTGAQPTKRAGIYLRVSTTEQARVGGEAEGYSVPYQRGAILKKTQDSGLMVVDEYIDLGFSGRDLNRPDFKRLLEDVRSGKITHVVVHKLDRLSRSRKADYLVDEALENAGAHLVSVVEYIDDTAAGKLNLQMYRAMAHHYSDNLGAEVLKGLTIKHAKGGTPGRAPLGYLNRRRIEDLADIRWVELDPDRAPLVRWAFEAYATGEWSLANLCDALTDRGLRTRKSARVPSRPLTSSVLHRMLSNPYYAGVVIYRSAYREGVHEPLVPIELWLKVQDVLHAHNIAGERDRTHNNYLRGSIWCGGCGSRMVFSQNKGRGGTYAYFFCMGKKNKANPCPRGYIRLEAIERGLAHFYAGLALRPDEVEQIRTAIRTELADREAQAAWDQATATKAIDRLETEREKLLHAHYDGAIPLDLLKSDMERITSDMVNAEKQLAATTETTRVIEHLADNALRLAEYCAKLYEKGTPHERRLLNQGFFTRIYLHEDGFVESAELQEPFAHLLAQHEGTSVTSEADASGDSHRHRASTVPQGTQGASDGSDGRYNAQEQQEHLLSRGERYQRDQRSRPHTVLLSIGDGDSRTPRSLTRARGSNKTHLAEAEGFEPPVVSPTLAFKASAFGRSATLP